MLVYALQRHPGNHLAASFKNNKITLFMPGVMATEWELTDIVGFDTRITDYSCWLKRILNV
jgi:hypothetical protein